MRAATESLLGQHVEAIVVVADDRRVLEEAGRIELEVPLVAVDSTRRVGSSAVSIDQYGGARMATEYLVSLGHTTIVHLAGPASSTDGGERERGWRDVLAEHGLASSPPLFGDWTPDSGYRLVAGADRPRLHGDLLGQRPDGAGGDARPDRCGHRGPRPTSASSASTTSRRRPHFSPPLTTVHQDFDQLGGDLMTAVLAVLDEQRLDLPARVPTLVERQSVTSAPPRPVGSGSTGLGRAVDSGPVSSLTPRDRATGPTQRPPAARRHQARPRGESGSARRPG